MVPDFPIIGAHVHLWDPERFRMTWLDGIDLLNRRYDLEEYREQTQGIPVEAMIYVEVAVEPAYSLLEAQWAVSRARQEPRLAACRRERKREIFFPLWVRLSHFAPLNSLADGVLHVGRSRDFSARFTLGVGQQMVRPAHFFLRVAQCCSCSYAPTNSSFSRAWSEMPQKPRMFPTGTFSPTDC